jgi:hypothetical protein
MDVSDPIVRFKIVALLAHVYPVECAHVHARVRTCCILEMNSVSIALCFFLLMSWGVAVQPHNMFVGVLLQLKTHNS